MLYTTPALVGSLSVDGIVPFLCAYTMLLFNSYGSTRFNTQKQERIQTNFKFLK